MKKVLVLNFEYPPFGGGGGVATKNIVEAMSRLGDVSIDVVTLGGRDSAPYEMVNERLSIWREGKSRKRERSSHIDHLVFLARGLFRGLMLAKRKSYACTHCHFIMPTGLIGFILKKTKGIPYVISVHGSDVRGYSKRFKLAYALFGSLWRIVLRNASAITVPHEHMIEFFDEGLRSKISVIPHFIVATAQAAAKENYILSSGRFIAEKRFSDLIEAVSKVDLGDWRLKIAGAGEEKADLVSLAKRRGIADKIDFLGWLESGELSAVYGKASLFIAPSGKESFGLTLLESALAGTYTIARDIPSHRDIVAASRSGELFHTKEDLGAILKGYVTEGKPIPSVDPASALESFDGARVISLYKRIYTTCLS